VASPEDEVAGLVVGREGRPVNQRGLGAAGPIKSQARDFGVPGIPLEHGAAVGSVPAKHRTRRVLADDRDALAIGVRAPDGLERPGQAIRAGRKVQHAGIRVRGEFIQPTLEGGCVVGLSVAARPVVPPRIPPAGKWAGELLLAGGHRWPCRLARSVRRQAGRKSPLLLVHLHVIHDEDIGEHGVLDFLGLGRNLHAQNHVLLDVGEASRDLVEAVTVHEERVLLRRPFEGERMKALADTLEVALHPARDLLRWTVRPMNVVRHDVRAQLLEELHDAPWSSLNRISAWCG